MPFRIISFLLFLMMPVSGDSLRYNSINNNGSIGLINMPSARFYDQGTIAFNFYKDGGSHKKSILIAPLDGIEISLLETDASFYNTEMLLGQQKSIEEVNLKIRLKEEGDYPAVAIGFNDLKNDGINSGEYIVTSYGIDAFDFIFGMGWGNLDGLKSYKNFLEEIDKNFLERAGSSLEGEAYENYFKGDTFSLFGGISAVVLNNFVIKLEYDSSKINNLILDKDYSRLNYGIDFVGLEFVNVGLTYEYGGNYGFHISLKKNIMP